MSGRCNQEVRTGVGGERREEEELRVAWGGCGLFVLMNMFVYIYVLYYIKDNNIETHCMLIAYWLWLFYFDWSEETKIRERETHDKHIVFIFVKIAFKDCFSKFYFTVSGSKMLLERSWSWYIRRKLIRRTFSWYRRSYWCLWLYYPWNKWR